MLEYRGYGLSQGSPSEEGLYMDVRTALDFLSLRHDVNHKEIVIFGRSLGNVLCTFHLVFDYFSAKKLPFMLIIVHALQVVLLQLIWQPSQSLLQEYGASL
jgi:hypothetical protein